jgi:RNA polymerase sigma-70 factor (ECF subfamily)
VSTDPAREHELSELMSAYQRGEIAAFDELYRRLSSKLRSYLTSLTWSSATAEDLLQETFLQLHRSRRTYRPPRPVTPWAFAIARHVYQMHRRTLARRSKHEAPSPEELPDVPVPPAVATLAARETLMRALADLTEDRREAVLLHHVFGFTFGEIGSLLGIREGTAKLRAHRAIHSLREILAPRDE